MNILRERLPITFRINDNVPNYQNFLNKIKDKDFITKTLGSTEGEKSKEPKKEGDSDTESDTKVSEQLKLFPVPWDPRQLIWQMNTFRHELKKNEALKSLHKLINQASESGLITRQELVSMLPPLLLDIQSTDLVFDMCAAPGIFFES
jgi:tRNA and rRNA cytosine-C5-methylases